MGNNASPVHHIKSVAMFFDKVEVLLHQQDMDAERSDRTIFVFGILHGSAGAGHLLGLIPILAMNHVMDVSFYMFAYLLGTIVAMVGFAQGMRRLSDFFITRHSLNLQQLIFTCSLTALVLGGVWLIT